MAPDYYFLICRGTAICGLWVPQIVLCRNRTRDTTTRSAMVSCPATMPTVIFSSKLLDQPTVTLGTRHLITSYYIRYLSMCTKVNTILTFLTHVTH